MSTIFPNFKEKNQNLLYGSCKHHYLSPFHHHVLTPFHCCALSLLYPFTLVFSCPFMLALSPSCFCILLPFHPFRCCTLPSYPPFAPLVSSLCTLHSLHLRTQEDKGMKYPHNLWHERAQRHLVFMSPHCWVQKVQKVWLQHVGFGCPNHLQVETSPHLHSQSVKWHL